MTHFNDQYQLLPLQADSTKKDFHMREDFWVFVIDNSYSKYVDIWEGNPLHGTPPYMKKLANRHMSPPCHEVVYSGVTFKSMVISSGKVWSQLTELIK